MLVLSRQKNESIMIGDYVKVMIVNIRGDKVRLSITAPKSIPVHREEVYNAIQKGKTLPEKISTDEKGRLVLSRTRDESMMIGDDVKVMIVNIRGDKVRLGITAPKSISVHRKEVYNAIQQQKKTRKQKP